MSKWEESKMYAWCDSTLVQWPGWRIKLAAVKYFLTPDWTFKRVWCRITDHKWVDEGYAGPDSGAIVMVCQRCDETHCTQLY